MKIRVKVLFNDDLQVRVFDVLDLDDKDRVQLYIDDRQVYSEYTYSDIEAIKKDRL